MFISKSLSSKITLSIMAIALVIIGCIMGLEYFGVQRMRYKANIPLMLEVIGYLTEECCAGNPGECRRFRQASSIQPGILPER